MWVVAVAWYSVNFFVWFGGVFYSFLGWVSAVGVFGGGCVLGLFHVTKNTNSDPNFFFPI